MFKYSLSFRNSTTSFLLLELWLLLMLSEMFCCWEYFLCLHAPLLISQEQRARTNIKGKVLLLENIHWLFCRSSCLAQCVPELEQVPSCWQSLAFAGVCFWERVTSDIVLKRCLERSNFWESTPPPPLDGGSIMFRPGSPIYSICSSLVCLQSLPWREVLPLVMTTHIQLGQSKPALLPFQPSCSPAMARIAQLMIFNNPFLFCKANPEQCRAPFVLQEHSTINKCKAGHGGSSWQPSFIGGVQTGWLNHESRQ